jgi:hypothetical protein
VANKKQSEDAKGSVDKGSFSKLIDRLEKLTKFLTNTPSRTPSAPQTPLTTKIGGVSGAAGTGGIPASPPAVPSNALKLPRASGVPDATTGSVDKLIDRLEKLTKFLTNTPSAAPFNASKLAGAGIGGVSGAATASSAAVAPLVNSIGTVLGKINSTFQPIASLVGTFNPAKVQQFERAFRDLEAVFGDLLQPVLVAGTKLVRNLADTLETMRPVFDPIIRGVSRAVSKVGELTTSLAQLFTPILGVLGQVLEGVIIPVFNKLVDVFKFVAKSIGQVINFLIDAINHAIPRAWELHNIKFDELESRSSQGKALLGVNRLSAAELGQATRQAAFGQLNWQQQTAANTRKASEILSRIEHNTSRIGQSGDEKGSITKGSTANGVVAGAIAGVIPALIGRK